METIRDTESLLNATLGSSLEGYRQRRMLFCLGVLLPENTSTFCWQISRSDFVFLRISLGAEI
jgi:hypothetical protein